MLALAKQLQSEELGREEAELLTEYAKQLALIAEKFDLEGGALAAQIK